MNGHASPEGGDNGGDVDICRPEDDKVNESISTVWNGCEVVLPNNCRPSESKTDSPKVELLVPNIDEAALRGKHADKNMRQSWRRTSSSWGQHDSDDYGWLRQLDLRSDIPSINEIRDWSFDALEFEDTILINVFIKMLEYYNLLEKFRLDRSTLEQYCRKVMDMHHKDCYYQVVEKEGVKEEYKSDILCEYHNWYHAVSCAHVSFLFLTLGGADAFLYPVEVFSIILGALIHDLDHPGTNNDFEVKRSTTLAKTYENDAVLERHSINMGLNLCQENPGLDWLKSFADEKDLEYVKHYITESVLATDPARHASVIKEALAFVQKGPQDYQSTSTSEASSKSDSPTLSYFNQCDPQHRLFIGRIILHCADISNPVHSSFEVASDWAIRVTAEFTRQAIKEKQLQLPVTPFMDGLDSEYKISKLQIGFFLWMVKPLFNTVGILFTKLKMLEEWGERNCAEYQAVIDAYDEGQKENDKEQNNDVIDEEPTKDVKSEDSA